MFSAGAVRIGMQNQAAKKTGSCLFFLCRLVKLGAQEGRQIGFVCLMPGQKLKNYPKPWRKMVVSYTP